MLNTFIANLGSTGVARKNRYRIEITGRGPQAAGGFDRDYAMMCESIEFPGQNMMSSADTLRYGPQREFINGVTYGSIQASFICSPDMREKRFFEKWQQQTMNMTTWEPKYYADYIGGMKIYQLNRANNATYVVELFEVYPKTITAQDVGNATNDAYQTVAVELDFHHWKWVIDRTPWDVATSDSVKEGPIEKKTVTSDSIEAGPDEGTIYGHTIDKNQSTTGIQ